MKKLVLLLFLIGISLTIYSQTKKYVYCQLIGTQKYAHGKVEIRVDFGKNTNLSEIVDYTRNEKGLKITFESIVDATNLMGKDGWEFVQAYAITNEYNHILHYWILRKYI